MTTAPDPSPQFSPDLDADPSPSTVGQEVDDDGAPTDTSSTRLMLTTAAHFVQQHLHSQLADIGLTPIDLSVLSGLAELPEATPDEIATQCLLSVSVSEQSLTGLVENRFVSCSGGAYKLTDAGRDALAEARALEDALFAEKSTTLRMELSSLISRLREGGVFDAR